MAATDALSSWAPQANCQPEPPMAQAPKPTGVINRSEFPSCFVFIGPSVRVFMISPNHYLFLLFHCLLPAAAEGFDQGDGGDELLAAQGGGGELDIKRGALGRGDFEICDEAVAILIVDYLQLFAGSNKGVVFGSVLI